MNKIRCLFLFIIIFIVFLVNNYNLNFIENIGEVFYSKNHEFPKIYDILHENCAHVDKFEYASDIISLILIIILIFLDINMFYNYLGFIIVIFIIRIFTNMLTILPKNNLCVTSNSFSFRGGCYDKVFSGHFASAFIASLILYKNNYINAILLVLINLINSLFIILSRNHYTIDIIMSFFVSLVIYQNNFNVCKFIDKSSFF
jgi:hypothetical protein